MGSSTWSSYDSRDAPALTYEFHAGLHEYGAGCRMKVFKRRYLCKNPCTVLAGTVLFILLAVLPETLAAPLSISLEDAYRIAVSKNPELEVQRSLKKSASGVAREALQGYLPTVSLDISYLRFDSSLISDVPVPDITLLPLPSIQIDRRDLGPADVYLSGVHLIQPVINLEAWAARRAALRKSDAAGFTVSWGEKELALGVINAYYGAIVAEDRLKVEKRALKTAEETLNLVSSMYEEGLAAPVDLYSSRAQVFELKARVAEARGAITGAYSHLRRIMGIDGTELQLVDGIPEPPKILDDEVNLERRFDIRAQQNALAAAEAGVNRARASYLPRLYFLGRYQWIDRDTLLGDDVHAWAIAVSLQWTIFGGLSRSGKTMQAEAERHRQDALLRGLRQASREEVVSVRAKWQAAMAGLDFAKESLINAEAVLAQTRGRYREGLDGITELLRAQSGHLRAEVAVLNSRYQAVLTAHQYRLAARAIHPLEEWR